MMGPKGGPVCSPPLPYTCARSLTPSSPSPLCLQDPQTFSSIGFHPTVCSDRSLSTSSFSGSYTSSSGFYHSNPSATAPVTSGTRLATIKVAWFPETELLERDKEDRTPLPELLLQPPLPKLLVQASELQLPVLTKRTRQGPSLPTEHLERVRGDLSPLPELDAMAVPASQAPPSFPDPRGRITGLSARPLSSSSPGEV